MAPGGRRPTGRSQTRRTTFWRRSGKIEELAPQTSEMLQRFHDLLGSLPVGGDALRDPLAARPKRGGDTATAAERAADQTTARCVLKSGTNWLDSPLARTYAALRKTAPRATRPLRVEGC